MSTKNQSLLEMKAGLLKQEKVKIFLNAFNNFLKTEFESKIKKVKDIDKQRLLKYI